MKVIIAYDIKENKIRRKIQKLMIEFSHTYQKSVYEIDTTKIRLNKIIKKIENITKNEDLIGIIKYNEVIYLGNCKKVEFII